MGFRKLLYESCLMGLLLELSVCQPVILKEYSGHWCFPFFCQYFSDFFFIYLVTYCLLLYHPNSERLDFSIPSIVITIYKNHDTS